MKKLLFLLIGFFLNSGLFAAPVSVEKAERVAKNWCFERGKIDRKGLFIKNNFVETAGKDTLFYVFNFNPAGFVMVSAEDIIVPVLGYGFAGEYTTENHPPAFDDMLASWKEQIVYTKKNKLSPSQEIRDKWKRLDIPAGLFAKKENIKDVAPLLTTTWAQGNLYKSQCPTIGGQRCLVGCVAVAMAQIMKYHNHPIRGTGFSFYNQDNLDNPAVQADFNTTYDWANMPNSLIGANQTEINATAKLLKHCGVSVEMIYGLEVSVSNTLKVKNALEKYFYYSEEIGSAFRDDNNPAEWEDFMRAELDGARPIMYCGNPPGGGTGHAFVMDGYQGTDHFHFNWGWEGAYNGYYYYLDNLTPGGKDFTSGQLAVFWIQPVVVNHPNGTLVRTPSSSEIYLIDEGLCHIPSETIFNAWRYDWNKIVSISKAEFNLSPKGPDIGTPSPSYPILVKTASSPAVYLLEPRLPPDTVKRPIKSAEVFESWGFEWSEVQTRNDLSKYYVGPPVIFRNGSLIRGSESTIYVVEHGAMRPIESWEVFIELGYAESNIIAMPDEQLAACVLDVCGMMIAHKSIIHERNWNDNIAPQVSVFDPGRVWTKGHKIFWQIIKSFEGKGVGDIIGNLWYTIDGWQTAKKMNSQSLTQGGIYSGVYEWTPPNINTDSAGIRLVALDSAGNVGYEYTSYFSIIADSSFAPLDTPYMNPIEEYADGYRVYWNAVDSATGYILQEDTADSFPVPTEYSISGLYKIFNNKPRGTYFCRVKAVNTNNESEWSSVADVTVKVNQPPTVFSPFPSNNATNIPRDGITLSWQGDDPDGDNLDLQYAVFLGTRPDSLEMERGYSTPSSHPLGQGEAGTTYYWYISAREGGTGGLTANGDVWCFTTAYDLPDLRVDSVTVDGTIQNGVTVTVNAFVSNIGNYPTSFAARYYYAFAPTGEDYCLGYYDAGALEPDSSTTVSRQVSLDSFRSGQSYIVVKVEAIVETESDLGNNVNGYSINYSDSDAPTVSYFDLRWGGASNDTFMTGHDYSIVFNVEDNVGISDFDFAYSLNNGNAWTDIVTNYTLPEGVQNYYEWTIPSTLTLTNEFMVRMKVRDLDSNEAIAVTDTNTLIDGSGPTVRVVSPNGGEVLNLGQTYDILWEASAPTGIHEKGIDMWYEYGPTSAEKIASQISNTGSYSWTIPSSSGYATTQGRIKIIATANNYVEATDASNAYFTVQDPSLPPPAPWHTTERITQVPGETPSGTRNDYIGDSKTDANGNVHFVYVYSYQANDGSDDLRKYNLYYMKKSGTIWSTPVRITDYSVEHNTGVGSYHIIKEARIAVDNNNDPHVVFTYGTNMSYPDYDDELYYIYYDGSSWLSPTNLSQDPPVGPLGPPSIDIVTDTYGSIHVLWAKWISGSPSSLYHRIRTPSGSWGGTNQIFTGSQLSATKGNNGEVHLLFRKYLTYGGKIHYTEWNGTSWTTTVYVNNLPQNANDYTDEFYPHIAVLDDRIHVCYRLDRTISGVNDNSQLAYSYYENGQWSNEPEIVTGIGVYPELKASEIQVNSSGTPQLIWQELDEIGASNPQSIYYSQRLASGWTTKLRLTSIAQYTLDNYLTTAIGNNILHFFCNSYYSGSPEVYYNYADISQDLQAPTIALNTFNSGQYAMGSTDTIEWIATDNVGVADIKLEYSTEAGSNFNLIAEHEPNDGVYDWPMPSVISDSCQIKVVAYDVSANFGSDISCSYFSIRDLTSPQVSVSLDSNSFIGRDTTAITWTATDNYIAQDSILINLSYSTDNGLSFTLIEDSVTNTGTYDFELPNVSTTQGRIRATAYDKFSNTSSDTSDVFSISVADHPPIAPHSPVPSDSLTNAYLSPNLSWLSGDIDGDSLVYDVYFDTIPNPITLVSDDQDSTNHQVLNLSKNRKYYWKIVANDGMSEVSGDIWEFTAGSFLNPPTNLTGEALSSSMARLDWNHVPEPNQSEMSFIIEAAQDTSFTIVGVASGDSLGHTVQHLYANSRYRFRVYATDGAVNSYPSSIAELFTPNTAPTRPSNPSPAHTSTGNPDSLTLRWNCADIDIGDSLKSYIYFGTSATPRLFDSTWVDTFCSVSNLELHKWYFWRIKAMDTQGVTSTSPLWSFVTDVEPVPSAPESLSAIAVSGKEIDLTWKDNSNNELGSKVERRLDIDSIFNLIAVVSSDTTVFIDSITITGNTNYRYRVCGYNGSGNSDYSNESSAMTFNNLPLQPFNASPLDSEIVSTATPELVSSSFQDRDPGDIHKASQWQLIDTLGDYANPIFDTGIDTINRIGVQVPSGLLSSGKVYYWHVKHQDEHEDWSDYSQETSFSVDTEVPTVPVLISPANERATNDSIPTFVWHTSSDASSGVDYYILQYADNPSFANADSANTVDTAYVPCSGLPDTTYYWRVKAIDKAANVSNWSSVWNFEIDTQAPSAPTRILPVGSSWFSNTSVVFEWSTVTKSPEGESVIPIYPEKSKKIPSAPIPFSLSNRTKLNKNEVHLLGSARNITPPSSPMKYILQVDTTDGFATPYIDTVEITTDTVTLSENQYCWRVRAYDLAGNEGNFSGAGSFGIDTTCPSQVGLISPYDSTYLNDSTVNFVWHLAIDNLSGIDHYVLQYALDTAFSQGLVETTSVDTEFVNALADTIYHWRARAIDSASNEGDWSAIWSFEIDTDIPDAPALVSPRDSAYLSNAVVSFEWSEVTKLGEKLNETTRSHEINTDFSELQVTGKMPVLPSNTPASIRLMHSKEKQSAIRYVLQVDTTDSFGNLLFVDTTESTRGTTDLGEDRYWWRVRAFDEAGNESDFSGPFWFVMDTTFPVIDSTTVLRDTTNFWGPFEVRTRVTDNAPFHNPLMFYRTSPDTPWVADTMTSPGGDWFIDSIPELLPDSIVVDYYLIVEDYATNKSRDPVSGSYSFLLRWEIATDEREILVPKGLCLSQNHPNPFIGSTRIEYGLPEDARVDIAVFNLLGQRVATLVSETRKAGYHSVVWDGKDGQGKRAASGVYFCKLEAGGDTVTKKMFLAR